MFLKKIIISGFKSFADRVVLSLDKGITGIVGPNGSGKSNVIDSVRWVMGEQNAKNLRGEKATDIIFAGSERRKALGMAEVSLVFDNSEESAFCPPEYRHEPEITLTRRLYVDGEREYLINRKPCRFKDIINFFATTGLGGRSYSMIQQGQVDRIVQASPEDMREIIEEAAGTMVFKKRKAEAQKKLEQTTANLARIDDILAEVEKSLSSLEGQVEKAKEWQELSDKLRGEEMSLFAHNYEHFNQQKSLLDNAAEQESQKEAELLATTAAMESRHLELQGQMDDADPELQKLQEQVTVLRERIASSEGLLKSARERIESGGKRLLNIAEEVQEDDANLRNLEALAEKAREEMGRCEASVNGLKDAISNFEGEVESADEAARVYQSRMEEFQDEIKNLIRLVEQNRVRTETCDLELKKAKQATAEELQAVEQLSGQLGTIDLELGEAEAKAAMVKEGLDQEIKDKHDLEAAIARRYSEIKAANAARDSLKERYHAQKARYQSLSELEAGTTDVAGDLGKLRDQAPDVAETVLGLLPEFLRFRSEGEGLPPKAKAAFERWTERLLVAGLGHFNELVRAAHRLDLGSLPVSVLSRLEDLDTAAIEAWAARVGAEPIKPLLQLEDGAPAGLERLLDRLWFLPAIDIAEDDLRDMPRGLLVFNAQGAVSLASSEFIVGGRAGGGLLSRKGELLTIAGELAGIEANLARAQATMDELDLKMANDRQQLAEIDARLMQQNQGVLQVMTALSEVRQAKTRQQELIDTAKQAAAKHEGHATRLAADLEKLLGSRSALETELETAQRELRMVEEESSSLIERKEELRRMHESKRLELARGETRLQGQKEAYRQTQAQLDLLQHKLSRRYEERGRLEQDIAKAHAEYAQSELDIQSYLENRERVESEYASKREVNAGVVEELRVIDSRLKGCRDKLSSLQKAGSERNVQLERLRMAISGVLQQAQEKYHLDLNTYEFERDQEFNQESKSRSVGRLRSKIEGLGAINMMALKEFEEKKDRRDFIAKQRDEVTSSMDLLSAAIIEIEETSLRKFMESFQRINEEFGQLFPILFPTGEARLVLTSPDNPMEGGVEIMCRMPGKAIQPMRVRSGGEKALTAMALVFALLRTKPTPYCFLDEVDAPLDEANVGRYNKVLEALSSQFQFIVITHNRRTMEVLDTLYGITMQEPGVSKVVGVDMQKDLPPHLKKAFKEDKPQVAPATAPRPVQGASAEL